jgi:Ca2+-binding EF-hand superfamily protein
MASLTPEHNAKAESAFRQNDEGSKGFLHSKEFFYACQALGFNYTFVECFEMYKIYDDNNSLRMNIDEFKRFYEAKLRDPDSHVDPTKVSNVYTNRPGGATGTYIPNSTLPTGTYTHGTTTVTQTTGPSRVIGGTTVTTGAYKAGTTYTGATTYGGTTVSGGRVVTGGVRRPVGTTTLTGGYIVAGNEMTKYDTEGKGWITKEQLRVACKDLAVKCDTNAELDAIWNEIDTNRTGRINSIEFGEFYDYVKGFRDIVRQRRAGQ